MINRPKVKPLSNVIGNSVIMAEDSSQNGCNFYGLQTDKGFTLIMREQMTPNGLMRNNYALGGRGLSNWDSRYSLEYFNLKDLLNNQLNTSMEMDDEFRNSIKEAQKLGQTLGLAQEKEKQR